MSKATNSFASGRWLAMPPDGGLDWPSCSTEGWPRGCESGTAHRRLGTVDRPTNPPAEQSWPVPPRIWSGCWPRWRWARLRGGETR